MKLIIHSNKISLCAALLQFYREKYSVREICTITDTSLECQFILINVRYGLFYVPIGRLCFFF